MAEQPLWRPAPQRVERANVTGFIRALNQAYKLDLRDYPQLWRWSVDHLEEFWDAVWQYCGVISGPRGRRVLVQGDMMPGARFFPDARINFAENLLRGKAEGDAIVFWGEDKVKRRLTHRELREAVSRMQQALKKA